jgi:3-hydroxyacyl-CoA dehydrogenase
LALAVKDAWLVVEAIPERLDLKISTLAELESLAPKDAILATNSSSYRSGEMLEKVSDATKTRIMNTHYFMPPKNMVVELMTDGHTDPAIMEFMKERQKEAGNIPYVARKESTGFIFNRLWAAVKREVLTMLADEVSTPEEIDTMWAEMFVQGSSGPCRLMDREFTHALEVSVFRLSK